MYIVNIFFILRICFFMVNFVWMVCYVCKLSKCIICTMFHCLSLDFVTMNIIAPEGIPSGILKITRGGAMVYYIFMYCVSYIAYCILYGYAYCIVKYLALRIKYTFRSTQLNIHGQNKFCRFFLPEFVDFFKIKLLRIVCILYIPLNRYPPW